MPRMETIRSYLGWCPNAAAAAACRRDAGFKERNRNETAAADGGREVVGGAVVDYGATDTPAVMALAGAGFFILVIYLSVAFPHLGALFCLLSPWPSRLWSCTGSYGGPVSRSPAMP